MTTARGTVVDEPTLLFGQGKTEKDPKIGLDRFGPYYRSSEAEASPKQVRIGVVASGETFPLANYVLEALATTIPSKNANRWLHPDFPGFHKDAGIECKFLTSNEWNATLLQTELHRLAAIADPNERIAACVNLYVEKIRKISLEDDSPDAILCMLPKWVEDYCGRTQHTRGASTRKLTDAEKARLHNRLLSEWSVVDEQEEPPKDFDLHNAMKGKSMGFEIPVQLLRESTTRRFLKQVEGEEAETNDAGAADFAWNLSTALYYKADGRPWRLYRLEPGTCYIGVSFFKNLRRGTGELQFAMAQVFTHSLEGFVVRGSEVTVNQWTNEPYMSEQQAYDLVKAAISKYVEKTKPEKTAPERVVVHKTSKFSPNERNGVVRAIGKIPFDLVSVSRTPVRFLRAGNYPVLRGTLISLSDREHVLYTSGYIPRLRTYPGARVPEPVLLTKEGDSDIEKVSKEILGLSKLDWNTTAFATRMPITIGFAQAVGAILSELVDDGRIQDNYRYYS